MADVDTFLEAVEDVSAAAPCGLIAEEYSNAAIARTLVVTPGAVEKHTQHIFARLGLARDEDQHRRVMATPAYPSG